MTKGRCAAEFKKEATKQVIKRGYTVADVAKRLGISVKSLYQWVKVHAPTPPIDMRRNSKRSGARV